MINGTEKFPIDIKKRLEHWNKISGLMDSDIEEKLHDMPELGGMAEKYVELNNFLHMLIK